MSWWDDVDGDDSDADEPYGQYDESSVRVRPNPKGNRPRTKTRPTYDDAPVGWVTNVDRGRFGVLVGTGSGSDSDADADAEHVITATKARELGKKSVVTGDHVSLVGDVSGDPGSLARIVKVAERTTLLRRSADDSDEVERVIVANADQMLIVVAAADPEPRTRLIDRYLVAAFDAGLDPILCITKTDLADPAPFLAHFACLSLRIVTSRSDDVPFEALHDLLDDKVTVTVGHSGVGKSTLVNALTGSTRAIGVVNSVTGRGRHTSSSSIALRVRDGGWIIDTPGVRSFGLGHVDPANVFRAFASHAIPVRPARDGIPLAQAHDWEIVDRVQDGELGATGVERLDSFRALLTGMGASDPGLE
ncbi:ribosome small subunit-dependent GTPase A [Curtobacterium flaccumfaciens pv. oortii]|uniref:ribosome small subunit-dependent GTPase A n=1 Tax=Curtobacterium flaccumfaciens TaxID=2035 RepID=UPI001BDE3A21|nr:ribosome small subunit-dependent GTPase A [Curtobacterium flaccumfaciens]MBT1623823.1 ribosome small subunit-dependent GTPase A [Curtobacterium flaccumfaciens pv. oortii]